MEQLPVIRKAENEDYEGVMRLYSQFTSEDYNLQKEEFETFLSSLAQDHRIYVLELEGELIGCATLLIEAKLIHNGSKVAHIEDVVIDEEFRGMGFGKAFLRKVFEYAELEGVYKIILNCSEEKTGFYEACGMDQRGVQMALYF